MIKPRTAVPPLHVKLVGGSDWKLEEQRPKQFTMIVAYRGFHCPKCEIYLRELDRLMGEFQQRGVSVLAVSCDTLERGQLTQDDWGLQRVPLGYGMTILTARAWGLCISIGRGKTSKGIEEPAQFSEPGLFLIRPDGTLYAAIISTMPFARPNFKEILSALDFILEKNYPARGEA